MTEAEKLLSRLSAKADTITGAIEKRQAALDRRLIGLEVDLFRAL